GKPLVMIESLRQSQVHELALRLTPVLAPRVGLPPLVTGPAADIERLRIVLGAEQKAGSDLGRMQDRRQKEEPEHHVARFSSMARIMLQAGRARSRSRATASIPGAHN